MSNKINDSYLESKQEEFEECVEQEDWAGVDSIQRELEENGFDIILVDSLTEEDKKEYRAWANSESGDESLQDK